MLIKYGFGCSECLCVQDEGWTGIDCPNCMEGACLQLWAGENDSPLLGLATTKEMLEEIEVRMRAGGSMVQIDFADRIKTMYHRLSEPTLNYRTVDH